MNKTHWHIIKEEGTPPEFEPKYSTDGHTESAYVLVFDSFYGPSVDRMWNGEWVSDRRNRDGNVVEPSVYHEKVAWAEITVPECLPEAYFKKIDKNGILY
jgi:hypothetical protein